MLLDRLTVFYKDYWCLLLSNFYEKLDFEKKCKYRRKKACHKFSRVHDESRAQVQDLKVGACDLKTLNQSKIESFVHFAYVSSKSKNLTIIVCIYPCFW